MRKISVPDLRAALTDGAELALIDVREEGVFAKGHLFWAACIPLSKLELLMGDLVPRRGVRIVLCDDGDSDLAKRTAQALEGFGYTDVSVLTGGTEGWRAAGGELFSGVNVPSKAFGEFVEHAYHTPRVGASELKKLIDDGADMVVLDSRPIGEYRRMNIPTGIDVPGAELVYRAGEIAPDRETLVVVNCAGRTRSIIGAQSLINAGIENRVVALKDGTMGWELAGLECERGSDRIGPAPSAPALQKAQEAAGRVAERFGVRFVDHKTVENWRDDPDRTLYLLDVRTSEEFSAGHLAGSRHAPGGQLVQGTDEFMAVRVARVVLIDAERVRAVMTASWLVQLGWQDVWVLEEALDGVPLETGPAIPTLLAEGEAKSIEPAALNERLGEPLLIVLDVGSSLSFRRRHVPGAWWGVRARMAEARAAIGTCGTLVLTSSDGRLARLAAAGATEHWPDARILALAGGTRAWADAGLVMEQGMERATTAADDVAYKPYDFEDDVERHMKDYLTWEVALVDQIARDGTVMFRKYD